MDTNKNYINKLYQIKKKRISKYIKLYPNRLDPPNIDCKRRCTLNIVYTKFSSFDFQFLTTFWSTHPHRALRVRDEFRICRGANEKKTVLKISSIF